MTSDNQPKVPMLPTAGIAAGICGAITAIFIVLKLGHTIEWSWLWVLAPLWGLSVATLATLAVALLLVWWLGADE